MVARSAKKTASTNPKPNRPVTKFEQSVYDTISKIPKGKVSTYKLVAEAIGCKSTQGIPFIGIVSQSHFSLLSQLWDRLFDAIHLHRRCHAIE